ncbi:MAG: imidazole glycerol phosphate synthase subunit HisH [Deltaproteobacteria bacterium]|nr:imidazole glycerol phosphate synthase subunit HisH [Deltaproteobacteria bacterium]
MIAIIDYGIGNLGSVYNMLRKLGADLRLTAEPAVVASADKLILPGVGAFDEGMRNLAERGLQDALDEAVLQRRTPILGICLGMQLFSRRSEEDVLPGLGWIAADTVRFTFPAGADQPKVPHMGWNTIQATGEHPLLEGLAEGRFYFVHSFYLRCHDESDVLATSLHGIEFAACLCRGNVVGTQFHPEKSHKFGLRLLGNFLRM